MRHVYVAADDAGRHKIGVTTNPMKRCAELSRDLGGRAVQIIHVEPHDSAALAVERRCHALLANRHDGGEWFAVDRAAAMAALAVAKIERQPSHFPAVPPPQRVIAPSEPRKVGRKPKNARSVSMKLRNELIARIEAWGAQQEPPTKTFTEAVERLIEKGLKP